MGEIEQPPWRRAATHTLHTALVLKALLEERLQERTGLLLADNEALINLAHSAGPLRMSDIADRLVLSKGGTTKVIDRLETLGYVQRRSDPVDRRATVVELTDAGRQAMDEARAVIDEGLRETWAKHVTDEEAVLVVEIMDRVLSDRWKGRHS